jgi:multidrug efflux pump subunit AcrB
MVERVHTLAKVMAADPDVGAVYYWAGANPAVNTGRPPIDLKPPAERKATVTDGINRPRRTTLAVPGIALFGQARQDVQIGARLSKTQSQYTPQDPNVAELFERAPLMLAKLAALPQLQDARHIRAALPARHLDRRRIAAFAVSDPLHDARGSISRQVRRIFRSPKNARQNAAPNGERL